jgi:hypothetical protein
MANENSEASKLFKEQVKNFDKYQKTLMEMFSMLKKTKEFKSIMDFPGIDQN